MNFEKVNWNYTMETDNIVPFTRYGSYSEFPLRTQPYPYVRAQRTRKAGAVNNKLIHHSLQYPEDNATLDYVHQYNGDLIPHSAQSLNRKSLHHTQLAQGSLKSLETSSTSTDRTLSPLHSQEKHSLIETKGIHSQTLHTVGKLNTRTKSASSQAHTAVTTIQSNSDEGEDKGTARQNIHITRRISWAFDQPLVPKDTIISLSEMKSLLRSQIRMKAESIIPPDFIYHTVSTIQKYGIRSATDYSTKLSRCDWQASSPATKKRPTSSPSRINLKTKLPVDKLQLGVLHLKNQAVSGPSPVSSVNIKDMCRQQSVLNKDSFTTTLNAYPASASVQASIHPTVVKTTIPQACIIRPVSAGPKAYGHQELILETPLPPRPLTTPGKAGSKDFQAVSANIAAALPGASYCTQRSRSNLSSTGQEINDVPLLMSTKVIKDKIAEMKSKKKKQVSFERNSDKQLLGEVSVFNHPLRTHAKFQLHTHQEEESLLMQTQLFYADKERKEKEDQMKKKKAAWLALATGKLNQ